jgi:hypothetical protein
MLDQSTKAHWKVWKYWRTVAILLKAHWKVWKFENIENSGGANPLGCVHYKIERMPSQRPCIRCSSRLRASSKAPPTSSTAHKAAVCEVGGHNIGISGALAWLEARWPALSPIGAQQSESSCTGVSGMLTEVLSEGRLHNNNNIGCVALVNQPRRK